MVEFVLEEAGEQFVGLDRHLVAIEIETGEVDLLRPDDLPRQPGDRQTALLEVPLAASLGDDGIDDGLWPLADVVDEEPFLHADLRCGEADTGFVVHRLEHVVGQEDELAVDVGDVGRDLPQDRVAEDSDLEGGRHGIKG
jgi:hypothetical protein